MPARCPLCVCPRHVCGGDLLDLSDLEEGMPGRNCLKGRRPDYQPVHCHGPYPLRGRSDLGLQMLE